MRRATSEDVAKLVELERLLFDNAIGEKMFSQEMKLGECWVEGDDPIRGYVLFRRDGDLVDILRLGVHPESQGKGVGKALLSKAKEGTSQVILTVQKSNDTAMKMYHQAGFGVVGQLHPDAWVLRWRRPITSSAS